MNGEVSVENISWADVIAPLLVAVFVGVGSSFVTTKVQIGSIQQRISRTEADIVRLRERADQRQVEANDLSQRVIRMETKLDLLLEAKGIRGPSPSPEPSIYEPPRSDTSSYR